ncbi:MAG: ATP-binding protein [Gammaproteobacteria bacterium]|nr:ATP-binding protein [Gammaproteobacteria bacterium]
MTNLDEQKQLESLAQANVRMILLTYTLQNIREFENEFSVKGDLETFYLKIVEEVTMLLDSSYGAYGQFDDDGHVNEFYTKGLDEEKKLKIFNVPQYKELINDVFNTGKAKIIDSNVHHGIMSLIAMPVKVEDEIRGVVCLTGKKNDEAYNETDEMLLQLMITEIEQIFLRADLLNKLADSNVLLIQEKEEQAMLLAKISEIQNQLLQSEKMASIGQLAAGVAHEINNPVGYVNSNISSLESYVEDLVSIINVVSSTENITQKEIEKIKNEVDYNFIKEDIKQLLSESKEGIDRVKKIVHDLKDFSHVDEEEWQWTDMHKGIDSTLNVVNNEIKYKAKVVKEYGDLPDIECIASQLNQVFMNLLVNASHAIEDQGIITIRSGKLGDDNVWVEISDTGNGIKEENISKLFEPFFTTKPVGKGTGLGLSLSYSIIQKHGGHIDVESELNKGTKFKITLPVKQPVQKAIG